MTILLLSKLWINVVGTGEAISGASLRAKQQTFEDQVDVRTYASGRRRAIGTVGEKGELTFGLVAVDRATKDTLRTWKGRLVQVRDARGQKWFGVFAGLTVTEYMPPTLYAVTFTLQLTTTVEGV